MNRAIRARYYRLAWLTENVAVPVCMVIAGLLALGFIP